MFPLLAIAGALFLFSCEKGPVSAQYEQRIMDRNLGARSNIIGHPSTMGLLYQWGRKDPMASGNYEYWLGGGSNTYLATTI